MGAGGGAEVQDKNSVRADGKSEFRSHELGSHFFWVEDWGLSVNQNSLEPRNEIEQSGLEVRTGGELGVRREIKSASRVQEVRAAVEYWH